MLHHADSRNNAPPLSFAYKALYCIFFPKSPRSERICERSHGWFEESSVIYFHGGGSGDVVGFSSNYNVGDSLGWTTGVDYSTWVSNKTFKVGDKLVSGS
ncbi:uncharacterized protein LOC110028491 isoform X2 [Phalaenopsis equestris]|uniref:uncharacterized protein LOC110028491 isoform X2 n=1 Tax=Phalaenopsis equestris TaxID=78828 RepID=UPI0009E5FA93|nr:uncharacterized protein LOC110028491 isoform X2 [Phalaenopsis equestris]